MVYENNLKPIENKKPIEIVSEIKDEYKVPTYEEFLKTYELDKVVVESYENEIKSYSDIGVEKGYGPCKNTLCGCFCPKTECVVEIRQVQLNDAYPNNACCYENNFPGDNSC